LGVGADFYAFGFQERADRFADLGVFASDKPRALFDDRHLCAKATVDLRELQPDIAAADDHKAVGQRVGRKQRTIGQIGDVRKAGQLGYQRAVADINKYSLGLDELVAHADRARGLKPRMSQ
jgi:hypothetical protein